MDNRSLEREIYTICEKIKSIGFLFVSQSDAGGGNDKLKGLGYILYDLEQHLRDLIS